MSDGLGISAACEYAADERYALPYPFIDLRVYCQNWNEAKAKGWMSDIRHQNPLCPV